MNYRRQNRMLLLFAIMGSAIAATRAQAQTLKSITVSPNPAIAGRDLPVQMHAIGTYSDGSQRDITTAVQWSASGVTVSSTGLFTNSTAGGTAIGIITATLGTVSASATANQIPNVDNQPVTTAVAVGQDPVALAANPVTDKIYVANQGSNSVTVIDGATNATTSIPVGPAPSALALNTVTNKIYIANSGSGTVTVIDGATQGTTTVNTGGTGNQVIVVNPVTNQVFVSGNEGIVQIDGATNNATTILNAQAFGMAVNVKTNTLYASGVFIYAINLANGSATKITVQGNLFESVLVNPALNQVYFGLADTSQFMALDGATNQILAKLPGGQIAFNPVTNQVIAASTGVTLYSATTNTQSVLFSAGTQWDTAAINAATNQVYLASRSANTLAVLDGRTGYVTTFPLSNPNGPATTYRGPASAVSTGGNPSAITVNPATNLVYVANSGTNDVTVVSGASNSLTLFSGQGADVFPAVDVNPFTSTGYFASGTNALAVVNNATGAQATIPTGNSPITTLVNPLTNQIYTLNNGSNNVTVINGATLATANIPTGKTPIAGMINPFTNTVYASNSDGSLTIFNGNTNALANLNIGALPLSSPLPSMAMNLATNELFIADAAHSTIVMLNANTNAVASYPAGAGPVSIAVNPTTNLVYTANSTAQSVTVLNPATGATSSIQLPFTPWFIAVNTFTNKIYAAGPGNSQLAVAAIDGATNEATTTTYPIQIGALDGIIKVDPVTNRIYIAGSGMQTVAIDGQTGALLTPSDTAEDDQLAAVDLALDPVHDLLEAETGALAATIAEEPTQTSPLSVTINGLPGNLTTSPSPSLTLTAADGLDPNSPPVENVYYRFDTLAGPWFAATANADGTFTATPSAPLTPGLHVLLAYVLNGGESSLADSFNFWGDSPLTSPIARYGFYVAPYQSITVQASASQLFVGGTEQLTATALLNDGTQMDVTNLATWSSSAPQVARVSGSGQVSGLSQGSAGISATYNGASGSASVTINPAVYQLRVIPSISVDTNGNYIVQIALTNQGNTTLNNVTLSLAELNSTIVAAPAPISSLAPGASATVQVLFPASAGAPNSRAPLKLTGSYSGAVPGGAPQPGSFSDSYRIVLP
jgi:YVTN family beta-propeller protein